jgi:hypothetical protein
MKQSNKPTLPRRWFQVHTRDTAGNWFVATAGGNPAQINAQAKGLRDKHGIAVVVSVRYRITRSFRQGKAKRASTPVSPSLRRTPRAPRVKAPQPIEA